MKQIKQYIIMGAVLIGSLCSCTKDFEKVNTNPNSLPETRPELLLESAIYAVRNANQTREHRLVHEMMQVHVAITNSDEIHRYIIRPSESDYMWNNWYLQRTNFIDAYDGASKLRLLPNQAYNNSYMAIARIMQVWVASLITDTYGNVPFTEANRGRTDNIYQPKFDEQKVIYDSLFAQLEEANTLLARNDTIPIALKPRDPLFGGDIAKWRRFGNSLYLRLLMRASDRPESNAVQKIKEIVQTSPATYPIMTSNAESAILRFTTVTPYVSAFNTYRDYDFSGENGLTEFFINTLNAWGDPRLPRWAVTAGGIYAGIPSGYAPGAQQDRQSYYQNSLKNEPLTGNILNYAELQFILAEAVVKGYITGSAKTYYENGVTNAITHWGVTVPAGYLIKPGIAWDDTETVAQKMEKIITQKYFTLIFTDFQNWFEYRRTGFPNLPIGPGVQNNGKMPTRLVYPVSVQSLNKTNYDAAVSSMGADDMLTRVWWDIN
ncbi:MAG TPA: SusD/RagB family nutrient-binding outer membrane lipoprotein [Chitinophagaceae bacterium]